VKPSSSRIIKLIIFCSYISLGLAAGSKQGHAESRPVRSIRFDPGFLYQGEYKLGTASLSDQARIIQTLIEGWKKHRINRVYILATNPVFGAFYATKEVPFHGTEQSLGFSPLIHNLIYQAQKAGIESYGWVYLLQSKHAWDANSSWRFQCSQQKTEATKIFLLNVANQEARDWFKTLIDEMFLYFPMLAGIDIAEPMTSANCVGDDQTARSIQMTSYLKELTTHLQKSGKAVVLTPHVPSNADGSLWDNAQIQKRFGLDIDQVMKQVPISALYPQILFQEGRPKTNVEKGWTGKQIAKLRSKFKSNIRLGVHLELGADLNNPSSDPVKFEEIAEEIRSVNKVKNIDGIDFYSSDLILKLPALP